MRYGTKKRRVPKRIWIVISVIVVLFIAASFAINKLYYHLLQPVSSSPKTIVVTIKSGSSVKDIGDLLEKNNIIKSSWALQLYVDTKDYNNQLEAGTYALSPSESTQSVVGTIVSGHVQTNLVTILPGKRIDQIEADLINKGYSPAEASSALNISNYRDLPIMAFLPSNVTTLEGLLWPDSFERNSTTPLTTIITESLNEMSAHLTPAVQADFASEGLTVYQGLTLASIVNQEVSNPSDQAQVAQVFLTRLKSGTMLESNVTAYYGADLAGQPPSINYPSAYNTYLHSGLPPTPISTISQSALNAAAHPADTNWLYFVTGDNGVTYFSTTLQQQDSYTAAYCHKLCSQ